MTDFSKNKGGYLEFMPNGKAGTLGTGRCSCGTVNEIKINKAGHPYRFCQGKNCMARETGAGQASAALLIARIEKFTVRNVKKKVRRMAGLSKLKKIKDIPEIQADHVQSVTIEPEPDVLEHVPEPVQEHVPPRKEPLIKFQLFGKDL
ncbi:MAG: hypothetical protein COB56_01105 [Robiginitomaculum sp.]|nr:MAG: hypothetical protein COB56_01105 [Robiginitomaculum sp.]